MFFIRLEDEAELKKKMKNKWINECICQVESLSGRCFLHSGSIFMRLRGSVSTSGRLLSSCRLSAQTRCPDTAGGLWGTFQASSSRFHPPLQTCKRPGGNSQPGAEFNRLLTQVIKVGFFFPHNWRTNVATKHKFAFSKLQKWSNSSSLSWNWSVYFSQCLNTSRQCYSFYGGT